MESYEVASRPSSRKRMLANRNVLPSDQRKDRLSASQNRSHELQVCVALSLPYGVI